MITGRNVENITAVDGDPSHTPGGIVRYRIKQGSRGKFVLDDKTGALTVAPGATFDYDIQKLYNLTVSKNNHSFIRLCHRSCRFSYKLGQVTDPNLL